MIISPEIIDDIKFRNPIEDVISSYIVLKRAGSNYNGLCPFHSEKTPSFTVFPSTQSFYCFGCGAGGDAITFVMRTENLDYLSALRTLAARCGITLPDDTEKIPGKKENASSMYTPIFIHSGFCKRAYRTYRIMCR